MVDAVIVSTARTPIGRAVRGVFNLTHGADMGGHVVAQAVKRAGIEPGDVEDVTMGCANPEGATGGNIARQCAIRAGLPVTAAAQTVNRFCSSGLQAIALAARSITQDGVPVAVAGGLESISLVQMNMNTKFYRNDWIVEHKGALYMPMIETADIVARRYGISREKQDEYSLMSQQRTAAGAEGRAVRRRDRADDHGHAGREQGDQGDLQAHRHPGARRGQPARHHARRPRQAEAGARRRPVHHRRQRQPALRRRLGLRADVRQGGGQAQHQADGRLPRLRGGRLRARRDGHRPGVRGAAAAAAHRPQDGRHRPVGAERGVRQPGASTAATSSASRRTSSTSTAAPSPSATPTACRARA